MPDGEDPRYMLPKQKRMHSLMGKQASKTTLNIMNVTFNSRPGVK